MIPGGQYLGRAPLAASATTPALPQHRPDGSPLEDLDWVAVPEQDSIYQWDAHRQLWNREPYGPTSGSSLPRLERRTFRSRLDPSHVETAFVLGTADIDGGEYVLVFAPPEKPDPGVPPTHRIITPGWALLRLSLPPRLPTEPLKWTTPLFLRSPTTGSTTRPSTDPSAG